MIEEICQECENIAVFRCGCIQIPLCYSCVSNHTSHLLLAVTGSLNTIEASEDLQKELQMIEVNFLSLLEIENKLNSCSSNKELIELSEQLNPLKSIDSLIDSICPKMYFIQIFGNFSCICEYNILCNTTKLIRKCCGFENHIIIEYPNEPAFLLFNRNIRNAKGVDFFKYSLGEDIIIQVEFTSFPNLVDFSFCVYGKFMFIVGGLITSQDSPPCGNNKIYVFSFENSSIECFKELDSELKYCVSTVFQGKLFIFYPRSTNQISILKLSIVENPIKIPSYLLDNIQCDYSDFLEHVSICSSTHYMILIVRNAVHKLNEEFKSLMIFNFQDFYFLHNIPCLVNPEGFYYIGLSYDADGNKVISLLYMNTTDERNKYEIKHLLIG